ncbi:MAG: RNA polymerase sigma factor [Opitutaceae bacterium]|nr:RNA polymerase sigma factor [Opitutaceae bacterium]
MPPVDQARWFGEEVKPHEPALRAYLQARFSSLGDHDDLVQETYIRILRAKTAGKVRYVRALLFTIAHNTALDCFRRKRVVPMETLAEPAETMALEEDLPVPETVGRKEELGILADAVGRLPERCRQVVLLRHLEGLSYKEIAVRLDVSTETVKTQLAAGMRRCADYFSAQGLLRPSVSKETVST